MTRLYDPAALRDSCLMALLGLETVDAIVALRRVLLEAIESLKPDDESPAHSRSWRYYHILYGRYTEQLTQIEIGADLGLGVRQLRRLETAALGLLADKLWTQFNRAGNEADTAPEKLALGREEE